MVNHRTTRTHQIHPAHILPEAIWRIRFHFRKPYPAVSFAYALFLEQLLDERCDAAVQGAVGGEGEER